MRGTNTRSKQTMLLSKTCSREIKAHIIKTYRIKLKNLKLKLQKHIVKTKLTSILLTNTVEFTKG